MSFFTKFLENYKTGAIPTEITTQFKTEKNERMVDKSSKRKEM